MEIRKKTVKTFILSLLLLVCTFSQAVAADPLLEMLPADCVYCVRVNDLSVSLAKMDQYLVGVMPMGTAMLVNMQLAGIVGDPMLTGINMNGTFAVVGLSDMTTGILVPVTDFDEFVKTNPNCTVADDGTAILTPPNEQGGMGKLAMTGIADGKYALVTQEAQKANLSVLKAAIGNPSSPLTARLNEVQTKEASTAPAWAYVNLALLYDRFGPVVLSEIENAEKEMTAAMGSGMAEFGAFYVKLYTGMFKQFAGDADSATLALTPEPANLFVDVSLRARDGSELAKMMVADPSAKGSFNYTGYLDSDNAVNGIMKWNSDSMGKFYDAVFDIMQQAQTDDAATNENIAKMRDLTARWMPLMGDEIAFSFSYTAGKPPFELQEVFGIKDGDKAKELMNESMGMVNDMYAAMGLAVNVNYQSNVSTYKNAAIDQIELTFPPSDDPNDQMQAALEQIYGGSLTYTTAYTDDTFYVTMGPDSINTAKKLIDQDPSAPVTGEVKAAFDLFSDTPYDECIISINVIKLMTGLGEMMQSVGPAAAPPGAMPPDLFSGLNLPSQSSLAVAGYSADGQVYMRTVLPKQHLLEIMNAGMQIQQKMMPPMQPGTQPGQAPTPMQPMP